MRISGWVPTTTDTPPEYVTLIAFPLQKLLHKKAPECNIVRTLPLLLLSGLKKICNVSVASSRRSDRQTDRRIDRRDGGNTSVFVTFCYERTKR